MCNGFVKIPRTAIQLLMRDPSSLQVYCYMMGEMSWSNTKMLINGKLVEVQPGQLVSSRSHIAAATMLGDKAVRTAIDKLEMCGLLASKPTNKYTIYTVINPDTYSDIREADGQQMGQQKANNGHSEEPAEEPSEEPAAINNIKNINNIREEVRSKNNPPKSPLGESEDSSGTLDELHPDARKAVEGFMEFRKQLKKPMTERAVKLLVGKLRKMYGSDFDMWQKSIEQSIMKNWDSVYEVKTSAAPKKYDVFAGAI